MAEDNKLVSETIITLIFGQLSESSKSTIAAVDKLTVAINELVRVTTQPPTRKDIFDRIETHDTKANERINVITNKIESHGSECHNRKNDVINIVKEHDADSEAEFVETKKSVTENIARLETILSKLMEFTTQMNMTNTKIENRLNESATKINTIEESVETMSTQIKDFIRIMSLIFAIGVFLLGLIKIGVAQFSG